MDDLASLTEGTGFIAAAENWPKGGTVAIGDEIAGASSPALSSPAVIPGGQEERAGWEGGRSGVSKEVAFLPVTQGEAWELVALEVRTTKRCKRCMYSYHSMLRTPQP